MSLAIGFFAVFGVICFVALLVVAVWLAIAWQVH